MNICRTILVVILFGIGPFTWADSEAETLFQQANADYQAEQYQSALDMITLAVELKPDESSYYHLQGKCYGRLAEQSNPLKAFSLSKKTRMALEKAVDLNGNNLNALKDLMEYYRRAPGFLGGSKKKADMIERMLEEFEISAG